MTCKLQQLSKCKNTKLAWLIDERKYGFNKVSHFFRQAIKQIFFVCCIPSFIWHPYEFLIYFSLLLKATFKILKLKPLQSYYRHSTTTKIHIKRFLKNQDYVLGKIKLMSDSTIIIQSMIYFVPPVMNSSLTYIAYYLV